MEFNNEKVIVLGMRKGKSLTVGKHIISQEEDTINTMDAICHTCKETVRITDFSLDTLAKNKKNEVKCMDCYFAQFNTIEEAGREILKHMQVPEGQLKEMEEEGWLTDEKKIKKMVGWLFGISSSDDILGIKEEK